MEEDPGELPRLCDERATELDDPPRPFFPNDFFTTDTEPSQIDPDPEILKET